MIAIKMFLTLLLLIIFCTIISGTLTELLGSEGRYHVLLGSLVIAAMASVLWIVWSA